MIGTSEVHGESAQQTVYIDEVGGLFCAGGADPFGVGLSDHIAYGYSVCGWPALEKGSIYQILISENYSMNPSHGVSHALYFHFLDSYYFYF